MSSSYSHKYKSLFKIKYWKIYLYIFLMTFIFGILIYLNYSFQLKNIKIEFFESQNSDVNVSELQIENQNIQNYLLSEINKNTGSFLNYLFLDNLFVTKLVRDEFQTVNRIDFNRKLYFNSFGNMDFGFGLYAIVIKNDEYFYACVESEKRDNFLVWAMQGNSEGEFYKEINSDLCDDKSDNSDNNLNGDNNINSIQKSKQIKFILNPKSLYSKETNEKIKDPDSLSGMRVYTKKDFENLKKIISYLQKNGFEIKEAYVNELKLIDINVGDYEIKVSLEKEVDSTISDFETISRTGKLQKYINDDKKNIQYIDLSFKDKVFYKLKNSDNLDEEDSENSLKNTTKNSTTTNSASTSPQF